MIGRSSIPNEISKGGKAPKLSGIKKGGKVGVGNKAPRPKK